MARCDTTLTERFDNSDCTCDTYPGNLGPCKKFSVGVMGDCVFCDHERPCHDTLLANELEKSKQ